ncbi:MAG: hypothetical protein K2N63_10155 [Lachnospiraceae bacterium]|nr:hypothetical protein [Lachnospiraceae bacterium]
MNHFRKNNILYSLFALLISCFLCACGNKPDATTETNTKSVTDIPDSVTSSPSAAKENDKPAKNHTPTPSPTPISPRTKRYHAIIYDNLAKGTKLELDITEGDIVNLDEFIQLLGYDFIGCYDSPTEENEKYIDQDGRVCTEVVSDVILYAWYEPKYFTLSFTCNGQNASNYGLQNVVIPYDSDICEFLPLNRIIDENKLIYSVYYNQLPLTDITSNQKVLLNEATFQDSSIFSGNTKIVLDLKTATVSMEEHFGLQEVCIKDDYDQFEQRFKDDYICDGLSFANIDFELLEKLGFNMAIINVTCSIREKDDGKQEIYVYNTAYENNKDDSKKEKKRKKKDMEYYYLGKKIHDCQERDIEETTTLTLEVPLSRVKTGTGIYVYYGASGIADDDWYRVKTDINVKFEQRLDK